jgi:hypothetical protein
METITKKCNTCKKALSVEVFGDNGKGECFKTCDTCRASGRERKAWARFVKDVEKEVEQSKIESVVSEPVEETPEEFWFNQLKTGRARMKKRDSVKQVVEKEDEDGWALMTLETLKLLSYRERAALPFNKDTVMTELNIFFFKLKIERYCGNDEPCTAEINKDIIEVWMPRIGGDFKVRVGDTWAEVRENIHCC